MRLQVTFRKRGPTCLESLASLLLLVVVLFAAAALPIAHGADKGSKSAAAKEAPPPPEQVVVESVFTLRYLVLKRPDSVSANERRLTQDVVEDAALSLGKSSSRHANGSLVDLASIYIGEAPMGMLTCEIQRKGQAIKPAILERRRASSTACLRLVEPLATADPKPLGEGAANSVPQVCLDLESYRRLLDQQLKLIETKRTPACGS
jgi:hypothetical protein